jgi:hypothetical protein
MRSLCGRCSQAGKRAKVAIPADETTWLSFGAPRRVGAGMFVARDSFSEDTAMSTDRTAERKVLVRFIEEAIEKSARTVEDVHKSIAQLPLKILEETDLLRGPPRKCAASRITRSAPSTTSFGPSMSRSNSSLRSC